MMGFFAFIAILVMGTLALVAGLKAIGASGRGKLESEGVPPQRLDRIETALSMLESRLDDLQDQQRFLERLLEDRPERPGLPPSGPSDEGTDQGTGSILFEPHPDDPGER